MTTKKSVAELVKHDRSLTIYNEACNEFNKIAKLQEQKKTLLGNLEDGKVRAYSVLIAGFNSEKLKKGSKRAAQIRDYLVASGITRACAKRYMENGQAARRLEFIGMSETNPTVIYDAFLDAEIDTEAKIKQACFPAQEKSPSERAAKILFDAVIARMTNDAIKENKKLSFTDYNDILNPMVDRVFKHVSTMMAEKMKAITVKAEPKKVTAAAKETKH